LLAISFPYFLEREERSKINKKMKKNSLDYWTVSLFTLIFLFKYRIKPLEYEIPFASLFLSLFLSLLSFSSFFLEKFQKINFSFFL